MQQQKLKFTLYAEPYGKGRPRFSTIKRGPKVFVHAYTPEATVAYEKLIQQAFREKYPLQRPFAEGFPLAILIEAYCAIPKSASKKFREEALEGLHVPTKKPDADNIGKIVLDALNKVAYVDDTQIVDQRVIKEYSNTPRLEITIIPATLRKRRIIGTRKGSLQCKMEL